MSSKLSAAIATCRLAAGLERPRVEAQWWLALDGSGSLGYCFQNCPGESWEQLSLLVELPGASWSQAARYHYVVETDIPSHAESEFNDWYEQEHLPGLANVEGTVCAYRFKRLSGGPRYLACYDLVTPDAMTSAAWLAVRGTSWSSRMRPLFQNTRRTLYVRSPAND